MRSIILVLCFIVSNAFCQSPLTEWALKFYNETLKFYNEIPPLNRKIIQEADKLIDKKVGKGLCGELIINVLDNVGVKSPIKIKKGVWIDTHWKELADSITIYPGDIILYDNHIAIIYAEISPSKYTIINQNFSGKLKLSHVGFGTVNLEEAKYSFIYRITL